MKKEGLIQEVNRLKKVNDNFVTLLNEAKDKLICMHNEASRADESIRRKLEKVLSGDAIKHFCIKFDTPDREKTISWVEIFFLIGELNSDANYSIMVTEKFKLQAQVERLIAVIEKNGVVVPPKARER